MKLFSKYEFLLKIIDRILKKFRSYRKISYTFPNIKNYFKTKNIIKIAFVHCIFSKNDWA